MDFGDASEYQTGLLDAVIEYVIDHGVANLSLRPLASALGYSTRVFTYNFSNKDGLLAGILRRLDDHQRERLRALPGWHEGRAGVGDAIRKSWHWQLSPENIAFTRLTHEIQGLAAGGRIRQYVVTSLADRNDFVAAAIQAYGVPCDQAMQYATFANATYAGLQVDYFVTGDAERTWAAVDRLATLVDAWIDDYS